MKQIIKKAKEWAYFETEKQGTPIIEHLKLSVNKGQELAELLQADKQIVMLGTLLMDIKLGECFNEGKLPEHISRSSAAAREFLESFDLGEGTKEKIINCIEAHHGTVKYRCKEAEICENADCYRFLHPRGVFAFIQLLGIRTKDFSKILDYVEEKLEEKHKVLSLDICKKELDPHYAVFKELLQKARE